MRHPVRCIALLTPLLLILALPFTTSITFAVAIGDRVELKATHQAGVPLHQEPPGTNNFQRVPNGTKATVIEVAQAARGLKLSLPDGRIGLVSSDYGGSPTPSPSSTETSPAPTKPLRIEEGTVIRVADGDNLTIITPNQTKLRIRMLGIDAPETPKGTKIPGQPYGKEAEAYFKQLIEGKHAKVEIYQIDRYKRLLSTIFVDGKVLTSP